MQPNTHKRKSISKKFKLRASEIGRKKGKRKGKPNRNIVFGTCVSTKQTEVFNTLEQYDLDITTLSQTKRKGRGIEEIGNYIHIYSGVNKECRAKKGISIAIHKRLKRYIKSGKG